MTLNRQPALTGGRGSSSDLPSFKTWSSRTSIINLLAVALCFFLELQLEVNIQVKFKRTKNLSLLKFPPWLAEKKKAATSYLPAPLKGTNPPQISVHKLVVLSDSRRCGSPHDY